MVELSFALLYAQDESEGVQLTVLTDRSQGGTSLRDGEMELMVSRTWLSFPFCDMYTLLLCFFMEQFHMSPSLLNGRG